MRKRPCQHGVDEDNVQDRKWRKLKLWKVSGERVSSGSLLLTPEGILHMPCLRVDPMCNGQVKAAAHTHTHSHTPNSNHNNDDNNDMSGSVSISEVRIMFLPSGTSSKRKPALKFLLFIQQTKHLLCARITHSPSNLQNKKQSCQSCETALVCACHSSIEKEGRK